MVLGNLTWQLFCEYLQDGVTNSFVFHQFSHHYTVPKVRCWPHVEVVRYMIPKCIRVRALLTSKNSP